MLIYKWRQHQTTWKQQCLSVNAMKALLTIVVLLWLNKKRFCSFWMVAEKKKKSSPKCNLLSGAEKWHSIQSLFTIYFKMTQWLITQTRDNYSISGDRLVWMYNICSDIDALRGISFCHLHSKPGAVWQRTASCQLNIWKPVWETKHRAVFWHVCDDACLVG